MKLKLHKFGIRNQLLEWISSYLSDRKQYVRFKGTISRTVYATSGVPQGSHLGPLLFNLFINDIRKFIRNAMVLLYADDMKIFMKIDNDSKHMMLQEDLDKVYNWCNLNKMEMNINKCKTLSFCRGSPSFTHAYRIGGIELENVSHMRDLGVVMDQRCDFKYHMDQMTVAAHIALGFMKRRAKEFKDPYVTRAIYISLVRPKLEYASIVWNPWTQEYSDKIESVQKQFLLFALRNLGWRVDTFELPPYEARLKLINLEPLSTRRKFFDVVFAYDVIVGNVRVSELRERIKVNQCTRSLRNRRLLTIPIQRRNYTMNEPVSRVSKSFNDFSECFSTNLSRAQFRTQIRKCMTR